MKVDTALPALDASNLRKLQLNAGFRPQQVVLAQVRILGIYR